MAGLFAPTLHVPHCETTDKRHKLYVLVVLAGGCSVFPASLTITEPQGSIHELYSHQHSTTIDHPQSILGEEH